MHSQVPCSQLVRSRIVASVMLASTATLLASCGDSTGVVREKADLAFVGDAPFDTILVANPQTGEIERKIELPMAGYGARISPNGDRVAISTGSEVWVANIDGSDKRLISANASGGVWSRDGSRLAYRRSPGPELRVVNADGSGDVAVPGAVPGGFGGIAWSPDGRRIAFEGMRGSTRTIYVVNIDGSGLRDIDLTLPGAETRASGEPTWSPDGRRIAFSRREFRSLGDVDERIWVATLSTNDARPITTGDEAADFRPSWSPDGSQIAFLRFVDDKSDVFVVRPNGEALQRITNTPTIREESPHWVKREEAP